LKPLVKTKTSYLRSSSGRFKACSGNLSTAVRQSAVAEEQPEKGIPTFICGTKDSCNTAMGKQVRGIATTFDGDSHLDLNFTTRKDDCNVLGVISGT